MAQKINVVQGDNNIKLVFNIKKDNIVEPILGAIIDLQFKNTVTGFIMKRKCVITESTSAECMYVLVSEDTQEVGGYQSELTINYINGTKITSLNPITLIIQPQVVEG